MGRQNPSLVIMAEGMGSGGGGSIAGDAMGLGAGVALGQVLAQTLRMAAQQAVLEAMRQRNAAWACTAGAAPAARMPAMPAFFRTERRSMVSVSL